MSDEQAITIEEQLAQEIARRENAEAQLAEATEKFTRKEERTRQILDTANDAFLATNIFGDIIEWNSTATELFGYDIADVGGTSIDVVLKPNTNSDAKPLDTCLAVVLNAVGEEYRGEMLGIHRDGHTFPIEVSISAMVWKDSFFFNVFVHDISNKKQMQAEMARAQKLESIGRLAAGIAHEINTPTQYVSDNVGFVQDTFKNIAVLLKDISPLLAVARTGVVPESLVKQIESHIEEAQLEFTLEEVPEAIQEAAQGVERVAEIVRSMKNFAHPGVDTMTPIDLNESIRSTITVSRSEWRYAAQLTSDLDESLPKVTCFPGDLNQVILNLIVNAAHAVADRYGDDSDQGLIHVTSTCDKTHAVIQVRDNGTGMSNEVRERIFDPFFTTKGVGKGTGQGLSLAFNVITEKHSGTIDVESIEGEGTTFKIRLPLHVDTAKTNFSVSDDELGATAREESQ